MAFARTAAIAVIGAASVIAGWNWLERDTPSDFGRTQSIAIAQAAPVRSAPRSAGRNARTDFQSVNDRLASHDRFLKRRRSGAAWHRIAYDDYGGFPDDWSDGYGYAGDSFSEDILDDGGTLADADNLYQHDLGWYTIAPHDNRRFVRRTLKRMRESLRPVYFFNRSIDHSLPATRGVTQVYYGSASQATVRSSLENSVTVYRGESSSAQTIARPVSATRHPASEGYMAPPRIYGSAPTPHPMLAARFAPGGVPHASLAPSRGAPSGNGRSR
ncbi:MAG TPA: hypothetical protein VII49_11695 [Rhizomicrobium sp.]